MKFKNYVDLLLKEESEECRLAVYFVNSEGVEICNVDEDYYYLPIVLNSEILRIYKGVKYDGYYYLNIELYDDIKERIKNDKKN